MGDQSQGDDRISSGRREGGNERMAHVGQGRHELSLKTVLFDLRRLLVLSWK